LGNGATSLSLLLLLLLLLLLRVHLIMQVLLGREDECTPSRAVAGGCLGNGAFLGDGAMSSSVLLMMMAVSD
jgi:hypothetical protein